MGDYKRKPQPDKGGVLIRFVPKQLRRAFKAWCNLRGITMSEKIIHLMRETVKDTHIPPTGNGK